MPTAGSRLAGEREYAFKHVLIRDVAYSTLPKAVRARKHAEVGAFISARAADRSEGVVAMVAEHYARGRQRSARRPTSSPASSSGSTPGRSRRSRRPATPRRRSTPTARPRATTRPRSTLERRLDPAAQARIGEKLGDVALRLGPRRPRGRAPGSECMDYHRGEEDLARVGDLHRKIGAGLWHKGDREGSIEHYQRGIDLLKDGPPCLELVRLYEEAASLYMHTGDNMLAIYASEKALRLAERLGEAAAASRAHGIFGRVFGRIGDSERARENLERSVELARDSRSRPRRCGRCSRSATTSRSPRPTTRAPRRPTARRSTIALRTGDLPSQVELHAALAQLAAYRGDWEAAERRDRRLAGARRARGPDRQALLPLLDARRAALARGRPRRRRRAARAGRSRAPSRSAARRSRSRPCTALAIALRDRGDHADADQALARALDLCERAGLVAQSVEATATRAVNLALWGKGDTAREVAEEAAGLAERLRYPVGAAASLEAQGAASANAAERARLLGEARDAWSALGRPVDAAALRAAGRARVGMSAWRQQALIEAPAGVGLGARRRPEDLPGVGR